MVFAAYEFVQKRAARKRRQEWQRGWQEGQKEERERINREVDVLFSSSDSDRVPLEDVLRIVRGNRE